MASFLINGNYLYKKKLDPKMIEKDLLHSIPVDDIEEEIKVEM